VDKEATEQPAKDLLAKLLHKTFALIKVNQSPFAVHHKKMLGLEQLSGSISWQLGAPRCPYHRLYRTCLRRQYSCTWC
jgi:hypothetical protein